MSTKRRRAVTIAALAAGMVSGVGCEDSCFAGRTRVRTPRGDRRLDELGVGDEVLAADPATGAIVTRRVTAVLAHPPAETSALDAGDVHVGGVTGTHPLWVVSRGAWIAVAELAVGDVLAVLPPGGDRACTRVLEAVRTTGRVEPVFDLTIEGPEHTFFADGVLAHNKTPLCRASACYGDVDAGDAGEADDATDAGDASSDSG